MDDILEKLKKGLKTYSSEETRNIAIELSKIIPNNTILALHGDLGVGKTTFVKGLAEGWGIQDNITSPTFNIFSIYKREITLVHLDAYRLENEAQARDLLLEEFLISPYYLVVEWPENIKGFLPDNAWHLYFSILEDESHLIKLEKL